MPMFIQYSKKFHTKYFLIISIAIFTVMFFIPSAVRAAYRNIIQAEGTLLYYWPMDESAGATSLTAAVGGTSINLTGATAGASGQVDGTAVSFNGTTNFGITSSTLNLTAFNKIIVEGVFYTDAYDDTTRITWELTENLNNYTTGFAYVQNQGSGLNAANVILYGSTGHNYALYSRPSAANWHHVVAVYNKGLSSNEVDLYIDGLLQTATSRPINENNTNNFGNHLLYLMSRGGTSYFSQGKLQHLAIYSDLSASNISLHAFNAGLLQYMAGVLSEVSNTSSTATVSWTNSSGGTSPYSAQLQRSLSGAGTWSNVSGATTSPVTDTGLSASTAYDYRVAYTDAAQITVYSNIVTITTSEASITYYAVQQADLWDNGYDNISAPRQSNFAHFIFTTNATSVTIGGTTSIYTSYPQFSHLGVRVNGVNQSPLVFTTNGSQSFTVSLGAAGTTRTVEIISGAQSKPSGTVIGSFIDSVTYANTASFSVTTPTTQTNRILVYGDSIAAGGNATNPEIETYTPLLRNTYGFSVMNEAWGYRALYDDTNTSGLRSTFISRIAGYAPATIWLAIGTNDYGLSKQNATNFGTAYAATLDDLHTALPSARIICQTPIVRSSESANSFGNTLGDYRNQISTVCNARQWTTLVDGSAFLTISDLEDGVHPSTSGHAKYALAINNILTEKPTLTTSAASSLTSSSAILNGSIGAIGSTTSTVRGFNYGLTTNYEIATTTESGSFSTGDFSTTISDLSPNTTYHFRPYATNFAGTSYGSDQTFYTLADTPTNLSASSNSNSVTLIVNSFPNDTSGLSGYYFSRSGANSGWIQTNLWTNTELSCGHSYNYSVLYRNGDGIETSSISTTKSTSGCGGGGLLSIWTLPTVVPSGGFKVNINSGASTTSNRNVFLGFNAGTDIKKVAISMTGDFTDASQEDYVASKQWDLCSKFGGLVKNLTCPDGQYTVYVKFYNVYGRMSDIAFASITIVLKSGSASTENLQQNQPAFSKLFTKQLKPSQTDPDIKRLQIFLNSDPDIKVSNFGEGSPGKETNFFGLLTKKAVIKFQEKYAKDVLTPWGLKKGTGVVGKTTLIKINELIGK